MCQPSPPSRLLAALNRAVHTPFYPTHSQGARSFLILHICATSLALVLQDLHLMGQYLAGAWSAKWPSIHATRRACVLGHFGHFCKYFLPNLQGASEGAADPAERSGAAIGSWWCSGSWGQLWWLHSGIVYTSPWSGRGCCGDSCSNGGCGSVQSGSQSTGCGSWSGGCSDSLSTGWLVYILSGLSGGCSDSLSTGCCVHLATVRYNYGELFPAPHN